ncbi:MAG TPA: ADP-ribosylglycohydrolase family protein [Tepidisphaeraceae bacterium]|jgi:ADP-ribosylglycohydrolase|nr:ADP-ribosylglycohydrolase family protein [Tepidisphaeraceae bacterium]
MMAGEPRIDQGTALALSRAQGCLLGQLAGDSLGSLVEFQSSEDIAFEYPSGVRELSRGGHWNTLAGQPTDDSELALMLARSLVKEGAFDRKAITAAYVYWYQSAPFDIGNQTATALGAAARGEQSEPPLISQANGALMRVSPLGIFGHAVPHKVLADWARSDAAITHPNAVCQDASAVFTVTIAHCVATSVDARDAYAFINDWTRSEKLHPDILLSLDDSAGGPPPDYSSNMGWVRIALQNAFYQLLHAQSLEAGLIDTVRRGGDTDTNAAIAGALLGAVYGVGAVPTQWRECILACRPIKGLAGVYRPRPEPFWPVDALELAQRLLTTGEAFAKASQPVISRIEEQP